DEIPAARGSALGVHPDMARVGPLDRERVAGGVDADDRIVVGDLRHDLALTAQERQAVLDAPPHARKPLPQPHLDALALVRLDGEDVEGKAALPGLLEQPGVAALTDHLVV